MSTTFTQFTPMSDLHTYVRSDGNARLTLDHQIEYTVEEIVEMFGDPEKDTVLEEALKFLDQEKARF